MRYLGLFNVLFVYDNWHIKKVGDFALILVKFKVWV